MNAMTMSQAESNFRKLIEQVLADSEPTVVVSDTGESIVMLSLDEFNAWQETLYLLSTPANAEHLRRSIEEDKAGQTAARDLIE